MSNVDEIMRQYHQNQDVYQRLIDDIEDIIKRILTANEIKISNFSLRLKSENTLRKKIEYKKKYQDISQITDVVACRIITLFESDLDHIVALLKDNFDVLEFLDKRQKAKDDYIEFGYNSIHMVVRFNEARCALVEYAPYKNIAFEIQIRTTLQHAWAEVEHGLGYKNEFEVPREIRRRLNRLSASLELLDEEFCRINEDIDAYNQSIEAKGHVFKTDINLHSLQVYVKQSLEVKKILDGLNVEVEYDSSIISELRLVRRFHTLGYLYIHELEEDLEKDSLEIIELGKHFISHLSSINGYMVLVWLSMYAFIRDGKDDPDQLMIKEE